MCLLSQGRINLTRGAQDYFLLGIKPDSKETIVFQRNKKDIVYVCLDLIIVIILCRQNFGLNLYSPQMFNSCKHQNVHGCHVCVLKRRAANSVTSSAGRSMCVCRQETGEEKKRPRHLLRPRGSPVPPMYLAASSYTSTCHLAAST